MPKIPPASRNKLGLIKISFQAHLGVFLLQKLRRLRESFLLGATEQGIGKLIPLIQLRFGKGPILVEYLFIDFN
jgi:hypothetical protein